MASHPSLGHTDPSARSGLSDAAYEAASRAVLARLEAQADRWLQEDDLDLDCARTGGLLELTLPNRSKVIVNTQPPLHEIWVAARRGGFHFRHEDGRWLDTRGGGELFALLADCLSEQAGRPLRFAPSGG